MALADYTNQRARIEHYFDRTAARSWELLTSDAPVGRIRATVRAGREQMQQTLLGWLPSDLTGRRILDAGCGTGTLAIEAARRGAHVTGIEISARLLEIARARAQSAGVADALDLRCADMAQTGERFDHVIAMDSVIHYEPEQMQRVILALRDQATQSLLFTVAPRTPMLRLMHAVGQWFPNADRSPAIVPMTIDTLTTRLGADGGWQVRRRHRVSRGFYISQALEFTP